MKTSLRPPRHAARLARSFCLDAEHVVPLSDGVVLADHSFEVHAVNETAAELLGWDGPAHLARHVDRSLWSPLDPTLRREVQLQLVRHGHWEGVRRLHRRDGSTFAATLSACVLHRSEGLSSGVVLVIRPVSTAATPATADGAASMETTRVRGLPGHFCLYYQAEVDLHGDGPPAAEALLRWWHPGLGVVSPGPALAEPIWADRLGALGVWSVFAVCRQAQAWAAAGHPTRVALNLSPHHLADVELVTRVRRALTVTGLEPHRLAIDLPARAFSTTPRRARRVAAELAASGVTTVLDDFSDQTPYAAVAGLEVDVVKVAGVKGALHAGGTEVDRARAVAPVVVAKAVETPEQLDLVRDAGFDRAFGHVFSPPMPAADLAAHLWP